MHRLIAVALLLLTACSGAARPPPAEYDITTPELESSNAPSEIDWHPPGKVCEPGESRSCKHFFYVEGQIQCPLSVQFCKKDGLGWFACADIILIDGQPYPPDNYPSDME